MKIFQIIRAYFIISTFISCRASNYSSNKLVSPSKKYYLIVTVNRNNKSQNNYGVIMLNLYDSNGSFSSILNTTAGDFNKWNVGWDKKYDTAILYSSDIGNSAWKIENNRLIPVNLNEELNKRADELKKEKYN